ncbi:unnamed protein product, partial [Choristocarpus tenellus]
VGGAGRLSRESRGMGGQEARPMPSTITGILGPSGAGKSSLLDILAGRREARGSRAATVVGELRLNGKAVSADCIRRASGYVTQEDVLPSTLTCREHLLFHARLRMRGDFTREGRERRVDEVLENLGLGAVKGSLIGDGLTRGISGGEKRRLSIAMELLTRPALLFLDEPTTGLGEQPLIL